MSGGFYQRPYDSNFGAFQSPPNVAINTRDPTTNDIGYRVSGLWLNQISKNLWFLNNEYIMPGTPGNSVVQADWIQLATGATGNLKSVNSVFGNVVGNVDFTSTGGTIVITPNAGSHTINIDIATGGSSINAVNLDIGTTPIGPTANTITLTGATVAAGTHPIRTDGTGVSTATIEVQLSQAIAATDATKVGLSNFSSGQFAVDGNGFVTLAGGTTAPVLGIVPDAHTAPGTTPVIPNGSGNITVTGGQTAPGTIANVIRSDSLAANTYTIEIQQTSVTAAKDVTKNGVAHFNSAEFTNDQGFISLVGGGAAIEKVNVDTGTSPVVPSSGAITVTGSLVSAGTHPVRTDGTGANTYAIEVQTSQAIAAGDSTKVGLCNFDSASFAVSAAGFVTLSAAATYISLSPFIVGTDAHSGFATIAAAITAAVGAGATASTPMNVYIKPKADGTVYTENLTLQPGVNLIGFGQTATIFGKCTYTQAGSVTLQGLTLKTNGDFCLAVTGSAASVVNLIDCFVNCSNNTGISFTTSSSSALITLYHCITDLGAMGIGLFSSSSAGTLQCYHTVGTNSGLSTTATTASAGIYDLRLSSFEIPFSVSGTAEFSCKLCRINTNSTNSTNFTSAGTTANSVVSESDLVSGTAVAVSIGAGTTVSITNTTIASNNINVLTGLGTLKYGGIVFTGGSSGHTVNTETAWPLLG